MDQRFCARNNIRNSERMEQRIHNQLAESNGYIIVSYVAISSGFLLPIMYSYIYIAGR